MSTRSLNKVMLIGNLTRDPNLRYTPNGTAVCTFGLATNRTWNSESGEKQEKVEFHNIVAWGKLADICGQFLHKGDKAYVEGRLQTRDWKGEDGQERRTTEIIIDNMMMLSSRGQGQGSYSDAGMEEPAPAASKPKRARKATEEAPADFEPSDEGVTSVEDVSDDIPF